MRTADVKLVGRTQRSRLGCPVGGQMAPVVDQNADSDQSAASCLSSAMALLGISSASRASFALSFPCFFVPLMYRLHRAGRAYVSWL